MIDNDDFGLKNPSFIYVKKNALTSFECKKYIEYFENNSNKHESGKSYSEKIIEEECLKKSTDLTIDLRTNESKEFLSVLKILGSCVEDYKKLFPLGLKHIENWQIYPKFNIQKYKPNEGFFSWHSENFSSFVPFSGRMLVWMIYLNTLENGGTEFENHGKLEAEEGNLVLWPPYWTHTHRGIISKNETKYIITGWYSYQNSI
jgi:hypothetical protein